MPALSLVRQAYSRRAHEYAELFGDAADAAAEDRDLIAAWAARCPGPIIDVGCGPGQWTAYLADLGHDGEGIDPVPEFVAGARRRYPACSFRTGTVADLGRSGATYGGALCWYSLIHLEPAAMPGALAAIRACLVPGGRLLVGFFDGERVERFDHAVTPAYFWPVACLAALVEAAGFRVAQTEQRRDAAASRPHAAIHARTF